MDGELFTEINNKLSTYHAGDIAHIGISVNDGYVTLSGRTPNFNMVEDLVADCQGIPGVKDVRNEIQVVGN